MKSYQLYIADVCRYAASLILPFMLISCGGGGGGGGGGASVSVTWTAPDSREDGSPLQLTDIAGYKVYYGRFSGAYTGESGVISCATMKCEGTVTGIPVAGTYFYVITTIDKSNRESTHSMENKITTKI